MTKVRQRSQSVAELPFDWRIAEDLAGLPADRAVLAALVWRRAVGF